MRIGYVRRYQKLEFVPYEDFSEIEEIGSGGLWNRVQVG